VRFNDPGALGTVVPVGGICLVALLATALQTPGTNWTLVVAAAVVGSALVAAAAVARSSRRLQAAVLMLPFAVDGLLALLRQAQGGGNSGYAPLAVLPVVWVGLTQSGRAVAAISACTALLFGLPILVVGAPMYPGTGWRGVVLWTVVAAVVGAVVHRAIGAHRSAVTMSAARATQLDRLIDTQTAISTSELPIEGVMDVVAAEALALVGGDAACVELIDGEDVVCSATAGSGEPFLGMRLKFDETITGECFRTGQTLICGDSETDLRVGRDACRTVGARSMIVVPLADSRTVRGVLIVWSGAVAAYGGHEAQLLALLANTSGFALARAELITQLTAQAVTDELTGLANRRAWQQRLDQAIGRCARNLRPLTVLLLDVDGLKAVNDNRGHAAGDELLREAARAWSQVLRGSDLLGRLGGDEFGVVLEEADERVARDVAARLHRSTEECCSVSIGGASWERGESAASLLERADQQMYRHKAERRPARHPVTADHR
jgi:diguanylate cyclase (GGDEF)-like protein